MELAKETWTKEDICEFYEFEKGFLGSEKDQVWEQRIINTKLHCFGRTSSKAKEIVKEIKKGNFVDFIEKLEIKSHLDSLIVAFLICKIKDFDEFENQLSKFVLTIDNWASSDTLRFQKRDYEKLYAMSQKFLKSDKPFVRRTALNIFFELIKDKNYLFKAFNIINSLSSEAEYYVNMCASWLLAECYAKYRDETLAFFENNTTNDFVINKAISKCRDSYRVSKEDKQLLLKFKRKGK